MYGKILKAQKHFGMKVQKHILLLKNSFIYLQQ